MAIAHRLAALALPLVLLAGAARAEDPEVAQLREQLRATVLQLRQLQDQTAAAPAPAATPPPDAAALSKARGQAAAARRHAADLQAKLDKANADNAALTAAAAAAASDMANLKAAYDKSTEQGRALAFENETLKAQLATMTRVATACQAKNVKLTAFAETMLSAYAKVGFGQVLAAREPFLGLKRVELENIAQDREDEVRADRCDPRLDGAAPARTAGG